MTTAGLNEELAAAVRVRNRLATSTTDDTLPRVLAGLLPRLLRRMDNNWAGVSQLGVLQGGDGSEDDADDLDSELGVRTAIHGEYQALVDHAVERVGGNACLDTTPFVETVADFLAESCQNYEHERGNRDEKGRDEEASSKAAASLHQKRMASDASSWCLADQPGCNAALCIVRAGLERIDLDGGAWRNAVLSVLKACILVVEDLRCDKTHRRQFQQDGVHVVSDTSADPRRGDPRTDACWLVLDSIALLSRVRPLGLSTTGTVSALLRQTEDSNKAHTNEQDESQLLNQVVTSIAPIARDGVYDLFIDLILFQPSFSGLRCGGTSQLGTKRMRSPAFNVDSYGDVTLADWVNLKLAVLRIATGARKGEGIFGWRGRDEKDDTKQDGHVLDVDDVEGTALVLLVLASSGRGITQDVHAMKLGRVAGSYLRSHLGSRHSKHSRRGSPMKKARESHPKVAEATTAAVIDTTTTLLCLALGGVEAGVLLRRHVEDFADSDSTGGLRWRRLRQLGEILGLPVGWSDASMAVHDGDHEESFAPSASAAVRSPLSPRMSCAVLDFVSDRLRVGKDGIDVTLSPIVPLSPERLGEEMILLFDLLLNASQRGLQLCEPEEALRRRIVMESGWGDGTDGPAASAARALQVLAFWLNASSATSSDVHERYNRWLHNACRRTLDMATTFLRSDVLPAFAENFAPVHEGGGGVVQDEDDDAPPRVEVPYRLRGRIRAQHRARRLRLARLVPPLEIRKHCVQVIREMVGNVVPSLQLVSSNSSDPTSGGIIPEEQLLSFDIPVLLLNCLVIDEALSPTVAMAMDHALRAYGSAVGKFHKNLCGNRAQTPHLADSLVQCVAPLLPALLAASSSESYINRRLAVRWTVAVVRHLDPDAAFVFCGYLVADPDIETSKDARICIDAIKCERRERLDGQSVVMGSTDHNVVLFLDSTTGMDREVLYAKLDQEVRTLADELGITEGAASILLQQHRFSRSGVANTLRLSENMEETLDRYGVRWRCRSLIDEKGTDNATNVESSSTRLHLCGICCDDDFSSEDMYALPCGHEFCRACFSSFLQVKLEDSKSFLESSCPQEGCNERVAHVDVVEIEPEKLTDWRKGRFDSFISMNEHYRWCPGIDCSMVALSDTGTGSATCTSCKACFCFKCGAEPHAPADCSELEDFMQLFKSSEYWIKKHAKPCPGPGCKAPIEKNTGCNHMHCSHCGCHFCWVCLTPIGEDGNLNRHICNKYDPRNEWSEKRRNEFYLTRFEAHGDGEKFAKRDLDSLAKKYDHLADDPVFLSSGDVDTLTKAGGALVDCRNFLKWTYVIAWALPSGDVIASGSTTCCTTPSIPGHESMPSDASVRKELFESHQATLEVFTENLSKLAETKLEELLSDRGERCFRMHLRALAFHTCVVRMYIERMIDFLAKCRTK